MILKVLPVTVGNNNSRALTLIELIVTITIVSILAGITMASMRTVNRPQQLVENVTNIMQNALNQANVTSLTTGNLPDVCSLKYDSGNGYAVCDTQPVWNNINGNKLPPNVTILVAGAASNKINYVLGLLPPASLAAGATRVTITISLTYKASCSNTINIWPNGVLDINNNASIANC